MESQFLKSAVEMLILEVASEGPTYGYALAQTVGERSGGYFELKEGIALSGPAPARASEAVAIVVARGRRPAAEVLRADPSGPHRAGVAQAVVDELRGGRQRRARHQPARSAGRLMFGVVQLRRRPERWRRM